MRRVVLGVAALALVLAGCGSGGPQQPQRPPLPTPGETELYDIQYVNMPATGSYSAYNVAITGCVKTGMRLFYNTSAGSITAIADASCR